MTNPDNLLDLAYPYALDALSADEFADVEFRLAEASPAVRAQFEVIVAEVRETMAGISSSTAEQPPARVRARVLDAINEPATATVIPLRKRRWALALTSVAAAIAFLVGSVVVINQLRQPTEISLAASVQSAPDREVTKLAIPDGGLLQVTFSRQLGAAVLHLESVAAPPAGKTYQLWRIEDGAPRSSALLEDPHGHTTIEDLGSASALALTIEPEGGSLSPTMDPIAVATL